MQTSRCVAGIDVHKKMLAVVVGKVRERTLEVERARFGTTTGDLKRLGDWLQARGVEDVVMESTGQYHKTCVAAVGRAIPIAPGASAVESWAEGPKERLGGCAAADHSRVYARGWRTQPGARDRNTLPEGRKARGRRADHSYAHRCRRHPALAAATPASR